MAAVYKRELGRRRRQLGLCLHCQMGRSCLLHPSGQQWPQLLLQPEGGNAVQRRSDGQTKRRQIEMWGAAGFLLALLVCWCCCMMYGRCMKWIYGQTAVHASCKQQLLHCRPCWYIYKQHRASCMDEAYCDSFACQGTRLQPRKMDNSACLLQHAATSLQQHGAEAGIVPACNLLRCVNTTSQKKAVQASCKTQVISPSLAALCIAL